MLPPVGRRMEARAFCPLGRTVRYLSGEGVTNSSKFNGLGYRAVAFPLLYSLPMRILLATSLLIGLLPVSCDAARVTLHGSPEVKAPTSRQDLRLMANERQVVHYRYLAAEQVGAASRLAEGGDVAGTTKMLFSAIEYQALAEEVEDQTADRLTLEAGVSREREPR